MKRVLIAALAMGLSVSAWSQPKPLVESRDAASPAVSERPGIGARSGGFRRPFPGRDFATSGPAAAHRQFLMEELQNVPLLQEKVRALIQLMGDRQAIARERMELAEPGSRPTAEQLKAWHDLLKREDALTSRQEEVVHDFVRDSGELQKQISRRRDVIRQKLESATGGTSETDTRNLWRARRMYDFLLQRLAKLEDEPDQEDFMRNMMRGMWSSEDMDPATADQVRRRLTQIVQEQEELRRRMNQLDEQVNDLREVLERSSPGRNREGRSSGPNAHKKSAD